MAALAAALAMLGLSRAAIPQVAPGTLATGRPAPAMACTPHSFPQRTQRSFAVDPTDERKLYIGVEQDGFFRSVDGGATWMRASSGLKAWPREGGAGLCYEEFYETVINPRNPDELCIARAGGPGVLATQSSAGNNGVYCSTDGALTWTQRIGPTTNAAALSLAADPRDFQVMYLGVNGGPCSNPPPACAPGTYFNTRGAIYKTTDGGATWAELDSLYVQDLRVAAVRIDPRDPDVVVASTFGKFPAGPPGNFDAARQIGVLRSTDAGQTWTASTSGMGADPREQALLALAIAPQNGARVFVTASSSRSYWSEDGGRTFHATRRVEVAAFDPHDPTGRHMLGANEGDIVESRDGGRNWTVRARTPGYVSRERGQPTQVTWSAKEAGHIFLSGPYASVHESVDGGTTWRQILSSDRLPQ